MQDHSRGPEEHINIRILHSGSKTQDKGDSRNHGLKDPCTIDQILYTIYYMPYLDPCVYVLFRALTLRSWGC